MTVSLQYTDTLGVSYKQDFPVMVLKGFTTPDEWQLVGAQHKYLNGSVSEQVRGFKRVMTMDFGVVETFSDQMFIWNFLKNPRRRVVLGTDVIYAAIGT